MPCLRHAKLCQALPSHVDGVHFNCSATPLLAAATQGFAARFVTSLALGCALPCHCRVTLNNAVSTPRLANRASACRCHTMPLPSLPSRAIPWHCLSFDLVSDINANEPVNLASDRPRYFLFLLPWPLPRASIDSPPVLHDLHKRLPSDGSRVPHGTFSQVMLSEEAFPGLSKECSLRR